MKIGQRLLEVAGLHVRRDVRSGRGSEERERVVPLELARAGPRDGAGLLDEERGGVLVPLRDELVAQADQGERGLRRDRRRRVPAADPAEHAGIARVVARAVGQGPLEEGPGEAETSGWLRETKRLGVSARARRRGRRARGVRRPR